jgi:phage terminase large subunit
MPKHLDPAAVEAFKEFLLKYGADPAAFVEEIIGLKLKRWQKKVLARVAGGARRISIRAGHGVGKSTLVACILIWSIICRWPQKSVVTAPSAPQLFDALFAELKTRINSLPPALLALVETFSDRVELKADRDGSFISARTATADRPEAMSGVHSRYVLLIADEAPGIPEAVYEAAVGSMSGTGALTILIGNPTRLTGMFFKTHHELSDSWETMVVSCLDPDLADIIDRDYIKQIIDTYGEESDQYRVRVLGEFPRSEMNSLISADLVDAAMGRDIKLDPEVPLVFGVDVARSLNGDRSAIVKRRGNVVVGVMSRQGNDLMETTGWVANEIRQDKPAEVCVDTIGLGAGVADRLRELSKELGCTVRDVNVAESNAMNPQAERLRDELWLTTRDWIGLRACKLPRDETLKVELSSPTFTFSSAGKYKVESKDMMRKRLKRSPDLADALTLTFAGQGALVGGRTLSWVPGKPLKRGLRGVV